MRVIARLLVIAAVISALGGLAYAAEVQGVLLDRMCSTKIVTAKDQKAAADHTRECGLMPDCVKSGYGVFTADGKFITFDPAGNDKAAAALKATKKTKDIKVRVTGEQTGDTMKVTAVKIL